MDVNAKEAGLNSNRLETISRHLMDNYINPGKISGCQVMVSRHGVPAYFSSFGQMDIERNKPVLEDTIFRIYSMTKPITSVALMMLFEEGRFQLNDPVSRFIPSWKGQRVWVSGDGDQMKTREPESPMTMRHLLSHTSGLTYGTGLFPSEHPVDKFYDTVGVNRDPGETIETFADKLSKVPLRYDPGTQWCYSLATDVCGCLVEFISGMPFEQFLQERILDPLGMNDTAFVVPEKKLDRLAANYGRRVDKTL